MSGTELDRDGTDSYHPQHPWEQVGHPLYLAPNQRSRGNWPPVEATPAGVTEEETWKHLPRHARSSRDARTYLGLDLKG